jgi:hypothetical protein
MRTEVWIVVCAFFAVAAFFAGAQYGEDASRPTIEKTVDRMRELELVVVSIERRERGVEPNLPPKHVTARGKVVME